MEHKPARPQFLRTLAQRARECRPCAERRRKMAAAGERIMRALTARRTQRR